MSFIVYRTNPTEFVKLNIRRSALIALALFPLTPGDSKKLSKWEGNETQALNLPLVENCICEFLAFADIKELSTNFVILAEVLTHMITSV